MQTMGSIRVLCLGILLLSALAPADVIEVSVVPPKGSVKLVLTAENPALVEESRELFLPAGVSVLRFNWAQERIEGGSLQLRVSPPPGGEVLILSTKKLHGFPQALYWDVQNKADGDVAALISYLLWGIGWKVEYLGFLNETEDRLDLRMSVELNNQSGKDLQEAEVILPIGRIDAVDLRQGSSCQVEMDRAAGIPLEKLYTYDPSLFAGKIAVHLKLKNDEGSALGRMVLPAGKIRLYKEPKPSAAAAMVGEDVFPSTAIREEAKIYIGNTMEVTVERKVLKSLRENERRDRWNNVVAYDQRERLRYEVANHQEKKITLKIVERISGSWEMIERGRNFEKKDAGTIEFELPLAERGKESFEIEYVCRDLW